MATDFTTLGRYKVLSLIGAGGMGEVYLGEDPQLRRRVALKILPANLAADQKRMRRFVQEAQAAAALNHPNIAHIYEIGEAGDIHFIAMEFVEGQTLREKIHQQRAELKKLLEYATQIAEGLAKAHAAGIVHRDLKPDNIIITREGHAKILDFGLAKLLDLPQTSSLDQDLSKATTVVLPQHSQPGTIIGTVGYMSPEQAQGKTSEIDYRSDIFSFGCVLYEMVTAHKPFAGASSIEILHKIVYEPSPPITDFYPAASADLQRILRRCLAKDPEERYQTVKDLVIELKELRSEKDGRPEPSSLITQASSPKTTRGEQVDTGVVTGPGSLAAGTLRPTSSAEYLVSEIRTHKKAVALLIAAFVLAISGIAFGLYRFLYPNPHVGPSRTKKISRLTTSGNVANVGMSPDGRFVAYVTTGSAAEGSSLRVRQVATNNDVQIMPPSPSPYSYHGPTFSPDGNLVYYTSQEEDDRTVLYEISLLGGPPRKVMEDVRTGISFSPNGKQFAFIRSDRFQHNSLMVANADGTEPQTLLVPEGSANFGDVIHGKGGVAWSPKGDVIAFVGTDDKNKLTVMAIPARGGTGKPITPQAWIDINGLAWLDERALILTGAGDASQFLSKQVWLLSYPSGEVRNITNDGLNDYEYVSSSANSSTIVTVGRKTSANIWIAPADGSNQGQQITFGVNNVAGGGGVSWTPDGRIVYHSTADGNHNVWIMQADGTKPRQLTMNTNMNYDPSVCSDGHYIVFESGSPGTQAVWRMDLDGGNLKQLGDGRSAQCSPDGHWVIYSKHFLLWRLSIDGGNPIQVTDKGRSEFPVISPDGKLIAAWYYETPNAGPKLAIIPFDGGEPVKLFDACCPQGRPPCIRWTPDGRAVTYISNYNIWSQSLDGGPPRQVTNFKSDEVFRFDWSRDGKQLVMSRGFESRDVVLISNFR
jgi:serine/threonine protein kinase